MANYSIRLTIAALLTAAAVPAMAGPTLLAEHDGKGSVSFEFVADPSSPVATLGIELPLSESAKGARVPEECFAAPRGFAALCNIDGLVFKAVLYSTNPDAVIPSVSLGTVQFPLGAMSIAKSGELSGLSLKPYDGMAKMVPSEVLSAPKGADAIRRSLQER